MPFAVGAFVDLSEHGGNQAVPVLVSSHGRVIFGGEPFRFALHDDRIEVWGDVTVEQAGTSLRDAVRWLAQHLYREQRSMPDIAMFDPQWALWIELLYEPNQQKTLAYADDVVANGFSPGVLIIDDNWSADYGDWRFRADQFPDPAAMVDELHGKGFAVMLWVCPYVSPDGINFLRARDRGLLIANENGEPAIRRWWNGYSAVLDLTNPEAVDWFRSQLLLLQTEFGIDGFKFDGGDIDMYRADDITAIPTTPSDQVYRFGLLAEEFGFNELRAGWNLGGRGLAMRLSDAHHSWDHLGIGKLVGNLIAQGLLGMPFGAPDMIGGGEYLDYDEDRIDPEVFVRHAQIAALSPMMQFSAAPWRLLDQRHLAAVKAAADLRKTIQAHIVELAHQAVASGDPILRPLEYEFPHQGFADSNDCFMLGTDMLVAPVLAPGATSRTVRLPPGQWLSADGDVIDGGRSIEVPVALETIPWFRLLS